MSKSITLFVIISTLSLLFNVYTFFSFRHKLVNSFATSVDRIECINANIFKNHSEELLKRIDFYIEDRLSNITISNNTENVNIDSSIISTSKASDKVIDYDYYFYISNGEPLMRIGIQDFRVGDRFPRGGLIADINSDCVTLFDGTIYVRKNISSPFTNNVKLEPLNDKEKGVIKL